LQGRFGALPVVLQLSSMAFPDANAGMEASRLHLPLPLLPVDGCWNAPAALDLRGTDADMLLLDAPPGLAPAKPAMMEDKEAGAFLLNLLKTAPEPSVGGAFDNSKTALGDPQSPMTSSTLSPASAATASAGDAAAEASPTLGGRRPTRRGRRAGHTRYN